jgi:hypothetical protein
MDEERFFRSFSDAKEHGFLPVTIPVPPMIERAFGYRGRRRFVALAYGVRGGVMGDLVGDATEPVPADLYKQLLLHPAVKPHTLAFKIEVTPPAWLENLSISETESRKEGLDAWVNQSRCLLLDRERRQFFVDTVSEVRGWLMLREALYTRRKKYGRLRGESPESAVHDLFVWLDRQAPAPPSEQFVTIWERNFQEKLAIRGCAGAGFSLGFTADDVRSLMHEVFADHESAEADENC